MTAHGTSFEAYLKGILPSPPAPEGLVEGSLEAVLPISNLIDPIDWAEVFGNGNPVEVDLGCGDGGFLVEYAAAHPQSNFLGTERLMGRINKIVRWRKRLGLGNIKVARIESGYFMKYLVAPGSLAAVHLYFPDPWPKKKHARHRLATPDFARDCLRAVSSEGAIYLRTDNEEYFAQMLESFAAEPGLEAVETPAELKAFQTDFEKHWISLGLHTHYAAYRRKTPTLNH